MTHTQWRKTQQPHFDNDGPYAVYSNGSGRYAVIGPNGEFAQNRKGKVLDNELAHDYCCMICKELNREQSNH